MALASCGGGLDWWGSRLASPATDQGADAVQEDLPAGDPGTADPAGPADTPPDRPDTATDPGTDPGTADSGPDGGTPDSGTPATCGFVFEFDPYVPPSMPLPSLPHIPADPSLPAAISHDEPDPPSVHELSLPGGRGNLVMPDYEDDLPLFERAADWGGGTRCYELPTGTAELTESNAYNLYRAIAETTTGTTMNTSAGFRSVVGIRGAYPGTFAWHDNGPNRFNDTLVLLWRDVTGARVLEFPANTDTGAYPHESMSSLWPNRRYPYRNGWHKTYNALAIDETGYRVRDDANHNGHWDSDRNGWLPPLDDKDFDRGGSAHNIHYARANAPLGTAGVGQFSAGCQNLPGMINWTQFITNAWTGTGDSVDYYLVDARDIDPNAWGACVPDGSHACPFRIPGFPYEDDGDTAGWPVSQNGTYNCSEADEGGPEVVYVFHLQQAGTVTVAVDETAGPPDLDVHLLMGDDPDACIARDDASLSQWLPPGRYVVVVDTFVKDGVSQAGKYHLAVTFE
jgi:hypothetical protein